MDCVGITRSWIWIFELMVAANPMDRIYFAPEKMSSSRIMEARCIPQERERKKMEEL